MRYQRTPISKSKTVRSGIALIAATATLLSSVPAVAATAVITTQTVSLQLAALSPVQLGKLSSDLVALASGSAGAPTGVAWTKLDKGQMLVKVLIVAASSDPDLVSLRADILARGGSVFYNYLSVRAVAAMIPSSALSALATRSDVVSISPNRAAQRQANLLQASSNAGDVLTTAGSGCTLDGRGVGIAVLDSGIDFRHRNFAAGTASRVKGVVDIVALSRSKYGDGWKTGVDYSPSVKASIDGVAFAKGDKAMAPSSNVPDAYGHGTAVASVAAGAGAYQSPDSSGIATGADLYDVRVLDEQGVGNVGDVLAGIDWVLQRARLTNIRVINLSLGADSTDSFLRDPLARAARSAVAAGIVVVTSAGNAGKDANGIPVFGTVSSPGHEPSVITVGAENMRGTASSADDVMATFSSRGPTRGALTFSNGDRWTDNLIKPDLVAPGNKVLTALGADASGKPAGWDVLARTYPELTQVPGATQTTRQTLLTLSGTSVAAPAVAGAAAVLLQANPGLTPPLVKAILQYTALPLPGASLVEQGTGLLNVEGAVRLAKALRLDLTTALASGTLKAGAAMLAPGMTLPVATSPVGGKQVAWSRLAYAGGTHLVSGGALFTNWQPIWNPAITWARGYVLQDVVSFQPTSKGVPANTVIASVVEQNAPSQPLLAGGVLLLDSTAGSIPQGPSALFAPVSTLVSRADSGMRYTLGSGFSLYAGALSADGFVLSQGYTLGSGFMLSEGFTLNEGFVLREGFVLNEGFVLREGFVLNEGFVLREGFVLNEGFILREATGGDAAGSSDGSFRGDK
jgi:subtilisin family serine protease